MPTLPNTHALLISIAGYQQVNRLPPPAPIQQALANLAGKTTAAATVLG